MWKRLITVSLTFGLAALAPPASAQSACGPHEIIAERLAVNHGEELLGRGLQSPKSLFEIWRSPDTGTWTIVMLRPDGTACVMASGFAWTDETPEPLGVES